MTAVEFRTRILHPGLTALYELGGPRPSIEAERMLLAIAGQESGMAHRYQVLSGGRAGPARGWWQFEAGGGVAGVMAHKASGGLARRLADHCAVRWDQAAIWRALEGHDALAVGFARLLLWTDPRPLPATETDGWACYLRNWRPGKPHPDAWGKHWAAALVAVGA